MRQPPVACFKSRWDTKYRKRPSLLVIERSLAMISPNCSESLTLSSPASFFFEDEHRRKMDFQAVVDVHDDSAPWFCKPFMYALCRKWLTWKTCEIEVASWGCHCVSSRDVIISNPWRSMTVLQSEGLHHLPFFAAELESAATTEAEIF